MINFDKARRLALQHIASIDAEVRKTAELRKDLSNQERTLLGLEPAENNQMKMVIIDEHTIEDDFGWVFFYEAKAYLDTGNSSKALAGNAPLLVSRSDGSVHVTGTARPIEFYIENFKRSGDPHSESNSQ